MLKTIGLPAYTYRVRSLDFLDRGEDDSQAFKMEEVSNLPFKEKYLISIEEIVDNPQELNLTIRLKEYGEYWRQRVRNNDTLSAVYKID